MSLIAIAIPACIAAALLTLSVVMGRQNTDARQKWESQDFSHGTVVKVRSWSNSVGRGRSTTHLAVVRVPGDKDCEMTVKKEHEAGTTVPIYQNRQGRWFLLDEEWIETTRVGVLAIRWFGIILIGITGLVIWGVLASAT